MSNAWEIIRGTILLIVIVVIVGYGLVRWVRNSRDEPTKLIAKWLISGFAAVVFFAGLRAGPFAVAFALVAGIIMAVLWTPSITAFFANPIGNLFDGGDEEPEAKPFYSIAIGQRMKGNYPAAIAEIQAQLEKFPNDYEGHLLLAGIQAECLRDMSAAETTVEKLAVLPELPPEKVAAALNALADWQWKIKGDSEAARRHLERIVQSFPETPVAKLARQRLAHPAENFNPSGERAGIVLRTGEKDLGLRGGIVDIRPPEKTPAVETEELVARLKEHPADWEAREKLALLYAERFQRIDLASQQFELLIAQADVTPKQTSQWLRQLADMQIRFGHDTAAAHKTYQRIIDRFPGSAFAVWAHTSQIYLRPQPKPVQENEKSREETPSSDAQKLRVSS
jgi:TolA-binding protein